MNIFLTIFAGIAISVVAAFSTTSHIFNKLGLNKTNNIVSVQTPNLGVSMTNTNVLAAMDSNENDSVTFNIEAIFNKPLIVKDGIEIKGGITADNIIYGVKAGSGISVGSGQTPVITNTGILSLASGTGITVDGNKISNSGIVSLASGTGISVSGSTITNSDLGSSQNIFKTVSVSGQSDVATDTNSDTLTFAGSGVTITTDATNDKITFTAVEPDYTLSGWTDNGTNVTLTDLTNSITAGASTLGATTVDSLDVSSGGITNAGSITGATGFTSSGQITLSAFSTGILHSNFSGVLSSSAVNLANSDVTGTLPTTAGGTGLTSYTLGDLPYASATNTLGKVGIGSTGQVLVVSGGIPTWGSITGGSGGICTDCLISDPGTNQTITPTSSTVTGLIVKQASSGSVDIFKVTDYAGTTSYLRVDSTGNVQLGNGQTTAGVLTVSPTDTDPISIAPVTKGVGSFTGTITSEDLLTQNRTWTFPDESGIVCTTAGNCTGTSSSLGGNGTANYISKWQGTYSLTNSNIYDDGTSVGIGTTSPTSKLHVVGTGNITGATTVGSTLGVTGATTLSSTLDVTGAANFLSTLGVTGATTLSSTVDITGNTTVGGNLMVNGAGTHYFSAGSVGIGTTTPTGKLNVISTTEQLRLGYDASNYWSNTVGATGGLTMQGVGTGGSLTLSPTAGQNVNVSLSTTGDFAVNTNQLYVDTSTGYVGVGTTAPATALEIGGSGKVRLPLNTSATSPTLQFGDGDSGMYQRTDNELTFALGGAVQYYFQTTKLALSAKASILNETTSTTNPVFVSDYDYTGTGIGGAGDILSLIAGGTNGLNVISSGFVGIGTTNPTSTLHVIGNISSPGTVGVRNEKFGASASIGSGVAGNDNVVIGYGATANWDSYNVVIGSGAGAVAGSSIAIGKGAVTENSSAVSLGYGAYSSLYGISIGPSSNSGAYSTVIGAGAGATAYNQFVAGSNTAAMSDVYFSEGVTNASPILYTIHGTGGSGSNIAGGGLYLAGGIGTGTGAGGSIVFQTAPAGLTGSTANTLATAMTIDSAGYVGIGTTAPATQLHLTGELRAPKINKVVVVDGTTYAQTCAGINAAIDALGANGGEVYLPQGTYTCAETVTIDYDNTTIRGSGWGTIINASADQSFGNVIDLNTKDYLTLSDFKMIGKASGGASTDLINGGGIAYSTFTNLYLTASDDDGLFLNGWALYGNRVENCSFVSNDGYGFHGHQFFGSILHNDFVSNLSGGMYIEASLQARVEHNNFASNTSYGMQLRNVSDGRFLGNTITSSGTGIYLYQGTGGNIISNNIIQTGTSVSAINVANASNIISNNSISSYTTGINIASGATDNVVSNNKFESNTTNIADAGTSTQITNTETGNLSIGLDNTPDASLEIIKQSTNPLLMLSSAADTNGDYLYVGNDGKVGIGTTAPARTLHLEASDGPIIRYRDSLLTTGTFWETQGGSWVSDQFGIAVRYEGGAAVISKSMVINNSGSVGIGTNSPTNILSLGGTAARTIWMERNTTAATAGQGLTISSGGAIAGTADLAGGDLTLKSGISTGTGTSALHFYTATAGSTGTSDNTPTEKMTILGSGNVGIGTTAPTTQLEVANGDIRINGSTTPLLYFDSTSGGVTGFNYVGSLDDNYMIYGAGHNKSGGYGHYFYVDGALMMDIQGTGDFALSYANADISFSSSTGPHQITTGGTTDLALMPGGNVGIGTTSPTNILSLGGTAARTIWMERNTTAATAGQGLTISSGGAIVGTADLAGGDLTFKSGISTGTGTSALRFYTATAGLTGTDDNTPTEKMTILGSGKVGIGNTNPTYNLDVVGSTNGTIVSSVKNNTSDTVAAAAFYALDSQGQYISLGKASEGYSPNGVITSNNGFIYTSGTALDLVAGGNTAVMKFATGGLTEKMRLDLYGNLGIGATAFGTDAAAVLAIKSSTAPSTPITDGIQLYAVDVDGLGHELKVMDEVGNATVLSPHDFSLIDSGPSEEMAWSFYSERNGLAINADMTKALRLVESLSGEKLIFIKDLNSGLEINDKTTTEITLTKLHDLEVTGSVTFKSTVEFQGPVIFSVLAEYFDRVIFHNRVTFEDKDMAGSATISTYSNKVDVKFSTPFSKPPIITYNLMTQSETDNTFLNEGRQTTLTNVTTDGFTIVLDGVALRDYSYNWIAIAAPNAVNTKSDSPIQQVINQVAGIATDSANLSPTPTSTVTPTIEITPSPEASATPTITQ